MIKSVIQPLYQYWHFVFQPSNISFHYSSPTFIFRSWSNDHHILSLTGYKLGHLRKAFNRNLVPHSTVEWTEWSPIGNKQPLVLWAKLWSFSLITDDMVNNWPTHRKLHLVQTLKAAGRAGDAHHTHSSQSLQPSNHLSAVDRKTTVKSVL